MRPFRVHTASEQVAAHLRGELLRGAWTKLMPGEAALATMLGVGRDTVTAAVALLEEEGLLVARGRGRRRSIVLPEGPTKAGSLRIQILPYEESDRSRVPIAAVRDQLQRAGYAAEFAGKSLQELGMSAGRVARFVERTPADAWVVVAGSHDVLDWFARQPVPAFALFGRLVGIPMAGTGPRKSPAIIAAVRRLVELGHRRIVMMSREERRKPEPGFPERVFLAELEAQGIATGPYNLPDWGNDMEGFHRGLELLLRHTPPTGLVFPEGVLFFAAQQHLALRGIVAPRDVSMISLDPDPAFAWCDPAITHIRWDHRPVVRRVLRWADQLACGRDDRRQTFTGSEFVEGGTIGPVPKRH